MKRLKNHPLADLSLMDDRLDRMFDRFWTDFFPRRWRGQWNGETVWTPLVDVLDKDTHLLVRADLPGLEKENVKISVSEDNLLTISGETTRSEDEKREDYYRSERHYGAFSRTIRLPENVIRDKVEASLDNGILQVTVPKTEVKKPKAVEVKIK
jgi:HSP20 family protein